MTFTDHDWNEMRTMLSIWDAITFLLGMAWGWYIRGKQR